MKKKICIICIIIILICIGLISCINNIATTKIDATTLLIEFQEDSIKAGEKYLNKDIEINGIIKFVDTFDGRYFIMGDNIDDDKTSEWLLYYISSIESQQIKALNLDIQIVAKGKIYKIDSKSKTIYLDFKNIE